MHRLRKSAPVGGRVCKRCVRCKAEEERRCMRRLPKGAPVGGRVCERCVRCKGGAEPGVSQSPEVRGRVQEERTGRLCSSASRRQGERGVQRARGDR
jgi:hypothetical protein